MIECRHIDFSYDSKTILQGIDLNIENGEFLCILGQSGCGKSTLLRLLAGLERPSAGEIRIDGEPVAGPDRHCSVVFQDYSLFPWMTTGANLTLALHAAYPDKNRKEVKALAESYLETVGLGGSFGQYPEALSGGMRQRAAIARALASPSGILLMDEPFGALDPVNRALLQELVRNLHRDAGKRRTVIFVTHDIDEALYLGTRLVVFSSSPGRIIADEGNRISRRYDRTALFRQPEIKALQQKIPAVYRSDMLERLAKRSEVRNGGGI
ncbi:ABC transporter ATP-binding protein [Victivallis vadensis]|uniref:ABC transporter ATP-binding protein n=2 Tax=Victivallis TaxID=172900 RepID=A0A2U1AYA5_9BACT|nr:ABC transporter ATP-binding protein [Victivallis vadensis]MBS5532883.1 ABC transporter ATP-binding protein [bacterium]NMD85524.1 ABC transporter ATP-binding protein [Victivallis vadensis]PVY41409.1 NitT/TauT family transport system ATP-binding protein [Victivallis vadensis]